MNRRLTVRAALLLLPLCWSPLAAQAPLVPELPLGCIVGELDQLGRYPTVAEIRCRYGIGGSGRFGLSFFGLPVYQSVNPLPGTHLVGVPGFPTPAPGESFEEWEWRVLRADFGPGVLRVRNEVELLHAEMIPLIVQLEARLRAEGIAFRRLESWRAAERQAFLFQQGRSRPGPFATTTLTSWHNGIDEMGRPAGRAVDYGGAAVFTPRFHELAREVGLASFGPDSHDPGHVYLPVTDFLRPLEVALLRTLPRVPEVTLATGRPVDERVASHQLVEYRREARAFLEQPFFRAPEARLAGDERPLPWFTEVTAAPESSARRGPGRGLQGVIRPQARADAPAEAAQHTEARE